MKTKRRRGPSRRAVPARKKAPAAGPPSGVAKSSEGQIQFRSPGREYRKVKTLVRAIFRENDAADIAVKLMKGELDATAGRVYLQLLEYMYGKPYHPLDGRGPNDDKMIFQFVSNVPRPRYPPPYSSPGASEESSDPPEVPQCGTSGLSKSRNSMEEDDHE